MIGAIRFGSACVLVGGLVMWGGLGQLDGAAAISVGGVTVQDGLVGLGGCFLVAGGAATRSMNPRMVLVWMSLLFVLTTGVITGLVYGNGVLNVAAEARPLVYAGIGVLVGWANGPRRSEQQLDRFARLLAVLLVLQFMAVVARPGAAHFLSGVNPGDPFTLGLPLVRPSGGYHLVGAALVMSILRSSHSNEFKGLLILGSGLLVTQSKTYFLIGVLATIFALAFRFKGAARRRAISWAGAGVLGVAVIGAAIGAAGDKSWGGPFEKFTLIARNPAAAYVVIGKRSIEFETMYRSLGSSQSAWLLGRGLGKVYRDPGALYYREDYRDRQRLAMFGHNYPMWLIVKTGVLGLLALALPTLFLLWKVRYTPRDAVEQRLAGAAVALIVSSLVVGSLEHIPGALTIGICLGALAGRTSATLMPPSYVQ